MNNITYISSPLGGNFYIDNKLFSTDDRPMANLIINNIYHKAIYQYRYGNDGIRYWRKLHIGYYENIQDKRFVSVADLPDIDIIMEFI